MQTLGLANSTERSDGRLKGLFWPSIHTGADVDYLGAQGYWVCAIVAVLSFSLLVMNGQPIIGTLILLFYYFGGVGVRERNRYAAAMVAVMYLLDLAFSPGVLRVIIMALLISNLRATWIASSWSPDSDQAALPPRLTETFTDKFADQLPAWLWPKIRILYYVLSAGLFAFTLFGLAVLLGRRAHP